MTAKKCPIPDDALDDRLAAVGTSGSGKSYNIGTAIERALALGRRVGIVDPTGVHYGLRLSADGSKASRWPIVIFGGPHGDLPLSENAGQLIGEACAAMAESFILDLSELGTRAAERRFMLAFYSALYRHTTGEPLILVTDEADMFAPQVVTDKDGGAPKLLGILETIVRRGRVKGFIPWLITQRPAVLNKNVLSQADGLIAMKLTSSQDRAAIGAWIEGQADKADAKRILDSLPSLEKGTGVVWIPARKILETATFPRKVTFDSGRTPKRGEAGVKVSLKPLDVSAIAGKLATIEAEVAAADPLRLKKRIAELERALAAKPTAAGASADVMQSRLSAERERGRVEGRREAEATKRREIFDAVQSARMDEQTDARNAVLEALGKLTAKIQGDAHKRPPTPTPPPNVSRETSPARIPPSPVLAHVVTTLAAAQPAGEPTSLTKYQREILLALRFWVNVGNQYPTRFQVAAVAGVSPTSSTFEKYIRTLRAAGFLDVPAPGKLFLTATGHVEIADVAPSIGSVRDGLSSVLTPYQAKIVDALPRDGSGMTRDELAAAIEQSPTSSTFEKYIRTLRALGIVTLPEAGSVAVEQWVWS